MAFAKPIDFSQARQKLYRYCAYQERCHQEVRNKLFELGLPSSEVDQLMADLITEGYLNEERFARSFAGGKFRMKKWGRVRIIRELESRGLTNYCIKAGLQEIDDAEYEDTLRGVLVRKAGQLDLDDPFVKRDKVAKYAIQKGFEPELTWRLIREELM